jgi:hypothetical protein
VTHKTLLYRFFRIGKLPAEARLALQREVILVQDEGIPITITYHDLRGPGRYHSWKRSWFSGAIALTQERLAAYGYGREILDIRLDDPRFKQIEWSIGDRGELWASFEAGLMRPDWSGRIDLSFATPQAAQLFPRLSRIAR